MFSKAKEAPSVVSTRVLRTHRLNEVETFRLHGRIKTIDNEIQTNYSQISDEIDGVKKNLVRIKKLKGNFSVSVERRKLLRQYGVFVIPSSSLDDDGVILRRRDGKKFVIKGKECYDGEVIRQCIDINFDSSQPPIFDTDNESDEDDESEQIGYGDSQFNKKRVLHYRIIVPPIHPGSRRNFRDYEELPKEDDLELVDLPPSESFMDNLRGSPLTKTRSAQTRKDNKQSKRHSKSQLSFLNSKTSDVFEIEKEVVGIENIEMELKDALDNLSINLTTITSDDEKKRKYLPSKPAVTVIKSHSRAHSPKTLNKNTGRKNATETEEKSDLNSEEKFEHSKTSRGNETNRTKFMQLPGGSKNLKRTQSAHGVRMHKVTARSQSADELRKTKGLPRNHSTDDHKKAKSESKNESDFAEENSKLPTSLAVEVEKPLISMNKTTCNDDGKAPKLLARRKSMDEGFKIHNNKQEQDLCEEVTDELREESKDVLTAETIDLKLLPEDACWTQMITRTTLPSQEDNFNNKKPSRRNSRNIKVNRSLFTKQSDERSVSSFGFHRKRTDSFNSTANSQTKAIGRGTSTASQVGSDTVRRARKDSHNEIIYDARPNKALSKGYSTMQMTIGGKQVKICIPKFSKDDVIDRARAKTAAQMADERTRGHATVKQSKQIKQA